MPAMTTVRRFVRLGAQPAQIRTASDGERDYLVMPVVALVGDIVVRPLNSEGPEFVPLAELAAAPGQWAGRPIVADHPEGGTGSANDPRLLVAQCYGSVYSPEIRNGKLFAEAWLDPQRAARIGGDAERVVEVARRALAGETVDPVEVSVGCWVTLIREDGVSPSGVPYEYRWAGLASDHLAVGLNGAPGACSIEDGCGTPRAAKLDEVRGTHATPLTPCSNAAAPQDLHPSRGKLQGSIPKPTESVTQRAAVMRAARQERPMNLMHRILSSLGFRSNAEDEGPSDAELRGALWDALNSVEPGFSDVEMVYPESGTAIYSTWRDETHAYWRRSFTAGEDGAVTLTGDPESVEPVMRWEVVGASAGATDTPHMGTASMDQNDPAVLPGIGVLKPVSGEVFKFTDPPAVARAACGCQTQGEGQAAPATEESESTMSTKITDLVGRLIANAASPYTEDDKAHLEALGEAKLEALDAALQPAEPEPKVEEPEPVEEEPDDSVKISADELADLRAAASAHKRQQAERKTALLAKLKGKQDAYTDDELAAMSCEQLAKVSKLAKVDAEPVRDYSGQGMPTTGTPEDDMERFRPPSPYGLRKKAPDQKEAN